jgi:hypothetical protein
VTAGAARPRGSIQRNSLLFKPMARATAIAMSALRVGRDLLRPMHSNIIARHLGFARAGRSCHDVGLVNDFLFTQKTSPGGAA